MALRCVSRVRLFVSHGRRLCLSHVSPDPGDAGVRLAVGGGAQVELLERLRGAHAVLVLGEEPRLDGRVHLLVLGQCNGT